MIMLRTCIVAENLQLILLIWSSCILVLIIWAQVSSNAPPLCSSDSFNLTVSVILSVFFLFCHDYMPLALRTYSLLIFSSCWWNLNWASVENVPAGLLLLAVYPVTSLLHSHTDTLAAISPSVGMGARGKSPSPTRPPASSMPLRARELGEQVYWLESTGCGRPFWCINCKNPENNIGIRNTWM